MRTKTSIKRKPVWRDVNWETRANSQGTVMDPSPAPVEMSPIAVPGVSGYSFPARARRQGKTADCAKPQTMRKGIAHMPETEAVIIKETKRREKRLIRKTTSCNFVVTYIERSLPRAIHTKKREREALAREIEKFRSSLKKVTIQYAMPFWTPMVQKVTQRIQKDDSTSFSRE
jgi:hypothetical protein